MEPSKIPNLEVVLMCTRAKILLPVAVGGIVGVALALQAPAVTKIEER